jgi:hypothetical protein
MTSLKSVLCLLLLGACLACATLAGNWQLSTIKFIQLPTALTSFTTSSITYSMGAAGDFQVTINATWTYGHSFGIGTVSISGLWSLVSATLPQGGRLQIAIPDAWAVSTCSSTIPTSVLPNFCTTFFTSPLLPYITGVFDFGLVRPASSNATYLVLSPGSGAYPAISNPSGTTPVTSYPGMVWGSPAAAFQML